MRDSSVKRWSTLHRLAFRLSRGWIGRRLVDNDILLLTTVGRVTAELHTIPLLFLSEGNSLIVIASYGGRDRHPEWYLNLEAHPEVEVEVRGDRFEMMARTADPRERSHWWPKVVAAYAGYQVYQARTRREIPIVILETTTA